MSGDLDRVFGFLCVFRGVLGNVTVLKVLYDVGFGGEVDPVLLSKHRSLLVGLGFVGFVGRGRYRLGFVALELFRFLYWVGYRYLHFFYSDPDEFLDRISDYVEGSSGSDDRSVGGTSVSEDVFEGVLDRIDSFGLGGRYRVLFEDADAWVYVRVGLGVVLSVFWRDPFCLRFWILYSLSSGSLSRPEILGKINKYLDSFSENCEDLPGRSKSSKDQKGEGPGNGASTKQKGKGKRASGVYYFTEQNVYKMIKRLMSPSWTGESDAVELNLYRWVLRMDYRGLSKVKLGFIRQYGASSYGAKLGLTDFGKMFLELFWELISSLYLPPKLLNQVRFINSAASRGNLKLILKSYVNTLLDSLRAYQNDREIIKRFFLFLNNEAFDLLIKEKSIIEFLEGLGIRISNIGETKSMLSRPLASLLEAFAALSSGAIPSSEVADLLVRSRSFIESDPALRSKLIDALATYLKKVDLRGMINLMKELYRRRLIFCENKDLCRIFISVLPLKLRKAEVSIRDISELLEVLHRHRIRPAEHEELKHAIILATAGKINEATPEELADLLFKLQYKKIRLDIHFDEKLKMSILQAIESKLNKLFGDNDLLRILEILLALKSLGQQSVESTLLHKVQEKFLSALGSLDLLSLIDFIGEIKRRELWGVLVEDKELYEYIVDLLVKKLRREASPEELPDYIASLPQDLQGVLLGRLF